jgi:hypothetical protein
MGSAIIGTLGLTGCPIGIIRTAPDVGSGGGYEFNCFQEPLPSPQAQSLFLVKGVGLANSEAGALHVADGSADVSDILLDIIQHIAVRMLRPSHLQGRKDTN